ncbi:hypothetical protein J41TS4_20470 [Paenibacillus apis]|uniref:Uncharacterized protein n=2 Tax=Paenibacillus apis TaxID=1792174 RepID=A0A919Y0E4_9BACL|nr:hypothetical protein J41TS4_20470 [Paenibacillus apis]
MYQYCLDFFSKEKNVFERGQFRQIMNLGIYESPVELHTGEVVVLSEEVWDQIRMEFPEARSPQMWVGGVIHYVPDNSLPTVYIQVKRP